MLFTSKTKDGDELKTRPAIGSIGELAAWKKQRAKLFRIRRIPRDKRSPVPARAKRILYARVANAAVLYVGSWEISWRRPWLLDSIWSAAWDAGWRNGYSAGWTGAHKALGNKPADIPRRDELGILAGKAKKAGAK